MWMLYLFSISMLNLHFEHFSMLLAFSKYRAASMAVIFFSHQNKKLPFFQM